MFPEDTFEEEIYKLAEGDFAAMNLINNTKESEVRKLIIIKSKQAFLTWYEMPDEDENEDDSDF